MGDEPEPKQASFHRLAHPRRTWTFVVACLVIGALSFGLGTLVRSPDAGILNARDQTVPVYSAVDSRAVTQDVRIQGEVVGSESYSVYAKIPENASRAVVTKVAVEPGTTLTNGTLLGAVSDRPIFVFSLTVPLFRNIQSGDSGSDVSSLQEALNVPASGVMDWQTLSAVRDLYREAGEVPPGGWGNETFVKLSEFVSLPPADEPPVVNTVPELGTLLDPDTPFVELSLGNSFVSVRASVSEMDQITVGRDAVIQSAGGPVETGVVTVVGDFQSQGTESGRPPGRDIRVELPEDSALTAGQFASVLFGSESEPVTAVPTLAIRSDSNGEYVLRRAAGDELERVPIVILRHANGWTALNSDKLSVGDDVLMST